MSLFDSLVEEYRKEVPDLEILYKTESNLMSMLSFLLRPLVPGFSRGFTTTLGSKVYFPSREFVQASPITAVTVLSHELTHILDERTDGSWRYKLSYLFPQILAVPTLIGYSLVFSAAPLIIFVLSYLVSCWLAKKWPILATSLIIVSALASVVLAFLSGLFVGLAFLVAALPLLPLPSPGRVKYELRGYAMSIATSLWLTGKLRGSVGMVWVPYFTGPDYYFMSWFPSKVEAYLEAAAADAESGDLVNREPFGLVYACLERHGAIKLNHTRTEG